MLGLPLDKGAKLIVPFHSSFNFYDMLIDIIDETGPYDSIVELGCGYGRNLIEIFYRGSMSRAARIGVFALIEASAVGR